MTNPSTTNSSEAPTPAATGVPCRYTARLANQIEARWQRHWDEHRTFAAPNPGEPGFDPAAPGTVQHPHPAVRTRQLLEHRPRVVG